MKISRFRIVCTFLLVSSFIPLPAAHASQSPTAPRQSLRIISISEHCLDEFDEEETIYINEGDPECRITVQVRGRGKTKSKILLQYDDYDDGWISAGYKTLTTNESGKATFTFDTDFPDEPGDDCYENDSFTHRFAVARAGKYKAFRSATFEVSYTSSDTNPACDDFDYDEE